MLETALPYAAGLLLFLALFRLPPRQRLGGAVVATFLMLLMTEERHPVTGAMLGPSPAMAWFMAVGVGVVFLNLLYQRATQ
jgi:hypothetical protein